MKDHNFKVVSVLIAITALSIMLHRLGFAVTKYDVLEDLNTDTDYEAVDGIGTQGSLSFEQGHAELSCEVTRDPTNYQFCSLGLQLSDEWRNGIDFSRHNSVTFDIDYQSEELGAIIHLYLRNYNDKYVIPSDLASLKFNAIEYQTSDHRGQITVPLGAFQVATWWITEYGVGFEDAQLEVDNVSLIEVSIDNFDSTGTYRLSIEGVRFNGEFISEKSLLQLLLVLWLVAVTLLINKQRMLFERNSSEDSLTGIMNRRGFNQWAERVFLDRSKKSQITVMFLDLDDFKHVNDSYGHAAGDQLLKAFTSRVLSDLQQCELIRSHKIGSKFSRLSGDEFAIVLTGRLDIEVIEEITTRLISSLASPYVLENAGLEIKATASVGIAVSDEQTEHFEQLVEKADAALFFAKQHGKNTFQFFNEQIANEISNIRRIHIGLTKAIERNQFKLVFMPICDCDSNQMVGSEVLVRCTNPDLEGIGPDQFISIAEDYGLIGDIDRWVIDETFSKIASLPQDIRNKRLCFSINISANELRDVEFPDFFISCMNKYGVSSDLIELEITETSFVHSDKTSASILQRLKDTGVSIALDDFGTGYTAFNQLFRYPVDVLKIDHTFVSDLSNKDSVRASMVEIIVSLARLYQLRVVAEGVETEQQLAYLRELDCDLVQGHYLSEPLSWSAYLAAANRDVDMTVVLS